MKKLLWRCSFWLLWPLVWIYSPLRPRARLLVVCGGEFLAVKSYFGSGVWQLPGGGIRFGETPLLAAVRELYEETELEVDPEDVKPLVPVQTYQENGLVKRYIIFSVVVQDKGQVRVKDREIVDLGWLPLAGPLTGCAAHIRQALHRYQIG